MTVISTQLAEEIGLDANHDGKFDANDPSYIDDIEIGGIGGTVWAPEMMINKLRIPTQELAVPIWSGWTRRTPATPGSTSSLPTSPRGSTGSWAWTC